MAVTVTQLRTLLAIDRAGSVGGAARQLFVTQPAVSSALAALERELEVELLERHGRGIRLTAAGRAYVPYASEVIGLLEQGRLEAREATAPQSGLVRVIAVHTAGEFILPALIRAYRELAPADDVQLEIGNRRDVLERLEARSADIGIGGRPVGRLIEGAPIVANELVVVARDPDTEIAEATWLMREEGSGTRAAAEGYLEEVGVVPRDALTLGSNGAVRQALLLGLGVALISSHAVGEELRAGTLHVVPAPQTPLVRPFHALTLRSVQPRPAVARFLRFLRSDQAHRLGQPG